MRRHIRTLSRARRACSYYHVDLHVHSPHSEDYQGSKDITPDDFISSFVSRGIDMVAITDHNSGSYIDQAVNASAKLNSLEGRKITVLSGVELSVHPGIHLLAILPGGGTAAIADLLSHIGLQSDHHGDASKLISRSIEDITRSVSLRRGILIGAHCNSTHGIVNELSGQARRDWIEAVDALEINSASDQSKIDRTVNYVRNQLSIEKPFTFGSDSHDCESNTSGMWIKMAEPSFRSLLQLTFEPDLRISRSKPDDPRHGRIVGFTATHGVYPRERFRFSPNLNVLLGGRGAGKSAAIDLLRFAFEAEPHFGDEADNVFARRIKGFLQAVGEVCVVAIGVDQQTYVIVRSGAYEISGAQSTPAFTDQARIYQVTRNGLVQRDIRPMDVLAIEFYGQGEVAHLADRVDEQMRLIDENLDHSSADASIARLDRDLEAGEEELIHLCHTLEKLRAEAATRPELEERRDRLSESLAHPVFSERSRWDRERTWIKGRQDWLKDISRRLPVSIPPLPDVSADISTSPVKSVLENIDDTVNRILREGKTDLANLNAKIAQATSDIDGHRIEWQAALQDSERQFRARLAEIGAEDLAQAAAELQSVNRELIRLEATIEPAISKAESDLSSLQTHRAQQLRDLKAARSTKLVRDRSSSKI